MEARFQVLAQRLRDREYKEVVILAGFERARQVTRKEALRKVTRVTGNKPPHLIVKYDRRSSPALGAILRNNHQAMVGRDAKMGRVFPQPHRAVYERERNLKDILTRAKLPPTKNANRHSTRDQQNKVTRCSKGTGRPGCPMCPFVTNRPAEAITEVKMPTSGQMEKVQGRLTCKQLGKGGFIYLLTCTKTGAGYLGESGRVEPCKRFQEHRRSVERVERTVGEYFADARCGGEELTFLPFIAVKEKDPYVRRYLEKLLISKHSFVDSPLGINRNH